MALKAADFRVVRIQAAAFTPDWKEFRSSDLLREVLREFSQRYDGEIKTDDLPINLLPQVPRISIASEDTHWRFTASPQRMDSIWAWFDEKQSPAHEITQEVAQVLEHATKALALRIDRVGYIVHSAYQMDDPAESLKHYFCNQATIANSLKRSETFELHNHKRYNIERIGLAVNSWVRCKSVKIGEDELPAVSIEQDINSLSEETEKTMFDAAALVDIFSVLCEEAAAILKRYFPGND